MLYYLKRDCIASAICRRKTRYIGGKAMSKTMFTALARAGATMFKSELEIQQKMYQLKRDNLNDVYKALISIVNLYPKSSPNDILKNVEYAPIYSKESFDSVIKSLDYQIEDYKNQLNIDNIDHQRKSDIETQISNREYSKKLY